MRQELAALSMSEYLPCCQYMSTKVSLFLFPAAQHARRGQAGERKNTLFFALGRK